MGTFGKDKTNHKTNKGVINLAPFFYARKVINDFKASNRHEKRKVIPAYHF